MGCGSCSGACCAAFPYPATPDQLRKRWEGYAEPTTARGQRAKRDDLYIADMLIPLEPQEIRERGEQFDLWTALKRLSVDMPETETMYTCRHWDSDTRLCTAYEDRPTMCADFPYMKGCEHGCDYRPEMHVRIKWSAIEVRYAHEHEVRERARRLREEADDLKRKAENSNPSA